MASREDAVRRTIGGGAVNWFNPQHPTGRVLSADFDAFGFAGGPNLKKQIVWIDDMRAKVKPGAPPFVFLNLAEDGLWAHGVSHAKTLEVPLLFRLAPSGQ